MVQTSVQVVSILKEHIRNLQEFLKEGRCEFLNSSLQSRGDAFRCLSFSNCFFEIALMIALSLFRKK